MTILSINSVRTVVCGTYKAVFEFADVTYLTILLAYKIGLKIKTDISIEKILMS